jgi:cytochrome oxidase Cu insertion factor (SCO1/SenC/PrrC family)
MSQTAPTGPQPTHASTARFWVFIATACALAVAGSLSLDRLLEAAVPHRAPPVYTTIASDLVGTERSGREVRVSELKGKVMACAYLYTVCPHGCAAVVQQMQKLHTDFGARPDFHQLSIAVAPDRDTPEMLSSFAEALGVKPEDHWWFVTGPRQPLVNFVTSELKLNPCRFIPPEERLNPADAFEHDLRIVLIDRQGRVRGYYDVFHPQPEIAELMCQRLHADTRLHLDHPEL